MGKSIEDYEKSGFAVRLARLITGAEATLSDYRRKYRTTMEFFAGDMYAKKKLADKHKPVLYNKLQQAVLIYTRMLAARNPEVLVRARDTGLNHLAFAYQGIINEDIRTLGLEREVQRIIMDTLFFIGVAKIGVCPGGEPKVIDDVRFDAGKPFISRVSPDDFFFDTTAKTLDSCQFVGDVVELDREYVEKGGDYGSEEEVKGWIGGAAGGTQKTGGVRDITGRVENDRLHPTVLMREIYIPKDNMILSMPIGSDKIVRVQEWTGPHKGPYRVLSFVQMPDNILPVPLVYAWYALAREINELFTKISRQASRQKSGLGVFAENIKDGNKIANMADGDIITLAMSKVRGGVNAITEELSVAGINQNVWVYLQWLIGEFDKVTGNLSLLGGLSPQSSTASQDEMLNARASVMEYDMKSGVVSFIRDVLEGYAYFHWSDPMHDFRGRAETPWRNEGVDITLSPDARETPFNSFALEIIPYSMEYRSPKSERNEFLEDVGLLSQYTQNSEYRVSIPALVKGLEERGNIDNLASLLEMKPTATESGDENVLRYESNVSPVKQHVERRVNATTDKGVGAQLAQAMQ